MTTCSCFTTAPHTTNDKNPGYHCYVVTFKVFLQTQIHIFLMLSCNTDKCNFPVSRPIIIYAFVKITLNLKVNLNVGLSVLQLVIYTLFFFILSN